MISESIQIVERLLGQMPCYGRDIDEADKAAIMNVLRDAKRYAALMDHFESVTSMRIDGFGWVESIEDLNDAVDILIAKGCAS